jgi:hypothetical protein
MKHFVQGFVLLFSLLLLTAQAQLTWPPQFAIGQTWGLDIPGLGQWTVELTSTDRTENGSTIYSGMSKSGSDLRVIGMFYEQTNDALVVFLLGRQNHMCVALSFGNPRGNTISGGALEVVSTNPLKVQDLRLECRLTLQQTGASSATVVPPAPPSLPSPPVPLAQTVLPAPAPTFSWPPQFVTGASLRVSITGVNPWAVSLQSAEPDQSIWRGAGVSNNQTWQTTLFFRAQDDALQMDFTLGQELYSCLFVGKTSIQGSALVGAAFYRATSNGAFQDLKRRCELRFAP